MQEKGLGNKIDAVSVVSFECVPSRDFSLLGANGTGKATTLHLVTTSSKEAQSKIAPINILLLVPMIIGLIPVLNVSLTSKEIFAGTIDFVLIAEAYGSSIVLAGLSLFAATRSFSMESVILRA